MEPQSKRAGARAVHSLERFVLSVPRLETAEKFFGDFGLDARREGERLALHTFGHPHCWGEVYQAEGPKRLQYLSFGIFPEDQDFFRERIALLGLAAQPHPLAPPGGIWLRSPDGVALQMVVADKTAPSARARPSVVHVPPGRGAAPSRSRSAPVRPRRLSHVLLFTPSVAAARAFYAEVLGLRLSDHAGDGIAFMHGSHGSDHHLLALAHSHAPGLHHTSWDVGSVHEVGLGGEHMKARGHVRGWGVGRHVLGSNYFYYVRDPWGSWCEYSFDIDYISADLDWPAAEHPPEDSFYVWGPAPPEDFVTNFEYPV